MQVIIVTGMSGAGKSQAANCLEDMGFYCIDNMPPALITDFVKLVESGNIDIDRAAFVVDIRGKEFFNDLKGRINAMAKEGINCKLMFLDASDATLLKRYNETRRSHPLSEGGSLEEDIKKERKMLEGLRKNADFIIDTSNLKAATLNAEIEELLAPGIMKDSFTVTVESFGYKNGILAEADWIVDARFLPNPFYVSSLKKLTGKNKKVKNYVLRSYEARDFVARITGLISDMIPSYVREGKYHLTIGVGCTGGQHRSVVIAEEIAQKLNAMGTHTVIVHRDLSK
ncbi:MAG: RNase adapter RapZ [Firmicutes bacterium]|nr:RNase adapter RapZ [Bacillota bacterium]MBR6025714.1 RNase adapter RapZ [Bacillota bacterium]